LTPEATRRAAHLIARSQLTALDKLVGQHAGEVEATQDNILGRTWVSIGTVVQAIVLDGNSRDFIAWPAVGLASLVRLGSVTWLGFVVRL
jgi:hypothetical protein